MSANTETVKPSFPDKLKSFHNWAGVDDNTLNDGQKLAVKYFMGAVILFIFQILCLDYNLSHQASCMTF